LSAFRRASAGHGALDAAQTERRVCMYGRRAGRLGRCGDPFVPPAWTKTPKPAWTITFAGPGRWSRAAYVTDTVDFSRKPARIVRASSDFAFGIAAAPVWSVSSVKAPCAASPRRATPRRPEFRGFSGCCPPSSRSPMTAFLQRRALRCGPRVCSGPRLGRGVEAGPPYIARVASDVPCPPRTGAARDRSQPLATASLGWRMVTLLGVAQLLDLGGATPRSGSAPFTLDQLAEWTGEGRPESRARSARAVAVGPAPRLGGPPRAPEEYL